ncbi:hypothetical protein, partial [Emticicia sp. TH156]|uniref:hypothetical protein n=1 Tax=Emticicia sp. TH156 TaxID=2067454 RepID=UPI000CB747ED
ARNTTGSVGFSGAYKTNGQEGCPPNCGGYGGGDPSTPYKAGTHFKPVSQQNATIKQGKLDNFTPEEKAAHLGVDMASAVEGGAGLLKGGASLLKNGFKFIKSTKAAKTETQGGLNLFKFKAEQTAKSEGWKTGDRMLKLYDQGSPKLNWKQNSGFLRQEMRAGDPIFDSYHLLNGDLIPTKGFLNAERYLLESRGWVYSPVQRAWLPPKR